MVGGLERFNPGVAFVVASLVVWCHAAIAADTWEPRKVYPDCRLTVLWPEVKKGLAKAGESVVENYIDEDGNNWLLFANHGTGSWSLFVMPPHMSSFGGACLHGHGGGLIPKPMS